MSMSSFGGGSGSMLVLNDPAAQLSSVEGKAGAPAAPVTNLSAFASSNDIVVKVCLWVFLCVIGCVRVCLCVTACVRVCLCVPLGACVVLGCAPSWSCVAATTGVFLFT